MRPLFAPPIHSRFAFGLACVVVGLSTIGASLTALAQSAPRLAPNTTKAFVFVPDSSTLSQNFQQTQFGDLVNDPVTQPFVDDLGRQLEQKFTKIDTKLGIQWKDLEAISSGELAIAVIQPDNQNNAHALVAMVEAVGRGQQVAQLRAKIGAEMKRRKATAQQVSVGQAIGTKYTIPPAAGQTKLSYAFNCEAGGWFFAGDNLKELTAVLKRQAANDSAGTLASEKHYQDIVRRTSIKENQNPDLTWFVEPFGFAAILRAADANRSRGKDYWADLKSEGFDAIKGIGGALNFTANETQVIHRTHALAVAGKERPLLTKGARILRFPTAPALAPPDWLLPDAATSLVANVEINEGFEHVGDLFDAIQGEGFWEELLDGLKNEPNGPRLGLKRDLIQHLGGQLIMMTRPQLPPLTADSEEQLVGIAVKDEARLKQSFFPALKRDPTFVEGPSVAGVTVWRHTPRDKNQRRRRPRPGRGGPNPFAKKAPGPAAAPQPPRVLAVAQGHLIYSNSEGLLTQVLKSSQAGLNQSEDYGQVVKMLKELGAAAQSVQYFTRLDRAHEVNFELLKANKMAKSRTLVGKVLNELFESSEPGVPRVQKINGANLPAFQAISKYLGTGGLYVREVPDGWEIVGGFLRKRPVQNRNPPPPVSDPG